MEKGEPEGTLQRKKQSIFSTWQKHLYVLQDSYLLEFKPQAQVGVHAPSQLYELKGAFIQDGFLITGKSTSFVAYLRNGKTIYFNAPTVELKEKWISGLRARIASLQEPENLSRGASSTRLAASSSHPSLNLKQLNANGSAGGSAASTPPLSPRSPASPVPQGYGAALSSPSDPPAYHESERRNPVPSCQPEVLPILEYLESFTDAVVIGDSTGSVVATNRAADQMFGWGKGELEGMPLNVLMPEPYKSQHDAYIFRHEKFGQTNLLGKIRNLKGERKDGQVFDLQLSLGKIPGSSSFVATIREITGKDSQSQLPDE